MEGESKHAHYTVAVRIRPNLSNSADVFLAEKAKYVKEFKQKSILTYCFDRVYEPEHSNQHIFEDSVRKTVRHFLFDRINTTLLAYGQTGSGKTYTLFGHQEQNKDQDNKGLAQFIAEQVCSQEVSQGKLSLSCSFMQVYKEKVTDLINEKQITLKQNSKGELYLQNECITRIDSQEHLLKLFHKANSNKIFGNSYVHSQSSRSHVICTIHLQTPGKQRTTKLNIVDLCGSEVLTYQFDEKQRSETNSINLSLFTLNAVVSDLCENKNSKQNKFIPFRNSVLTRILKSSLVNVHKTQVYLFCNISPEKQHKDFSSSTLRFGQLAIQIDQNQNYKGQQKINLSQQKRQKKMVSNVIQVNPKPLKHYPSYRKWETQMITILKNKIKVYRQVNDPSSSVNVLILHAYGYGCCGDDWDILRPFIAEAYPSCNFYSVDFPGFGESSGDKFTSRAQKFTEKGQPLQFMGELFKAFKFSPKNKVILIGYDLGGAVALSSSFNQSLSKSIAACIVFHPTWTDSIEKLALISLPVLLLWVPVQTFHLISAGTKMAKVIKGAVLYKLNIGPYTGEKAGGYYHMYTDTLARIMTEFIKSIRPVEQEQNTRNRRGKVMQEDIIVDIDKEEQKLFKIQESVSEFYSLIGKKAQKDIFQAIAKGGQSKPKAIRLASELPTLDVNTINFQNLIKWRIVDAEPKGKLQLQNLPMLVVGRQLQVKTKINLSVLHGTDTYLAHVNAKSKLKGQWGVTHKAYVSADQTEEQILAKGQLKVEVLLPDRTRQQIQVKLDSIVQLNSATVFRRNPATNSLVFEDEVSCKYGSKMVKLKMLQCFYAIKDLIPQMDFTKNDQNLLMAQKDCTRRIYKLLDLRHLVHEGIDNTRFTGIDVGRLAYYGQGNCHHLAGVTAAFLMPFGKLLGWDVIFRAGSFYKTGRELDEAGQPVAGWDGRPNVKVQDHTWLEIVYKPSYQLTVFDPSFDICSEPADEIYTLRGKMHISDRLQCGSMHPPVPKYLFDAKQTAL